MLFGSSMINVSKQIKEIIQFEDRDHKIKSESQNGNIFWVFLTIFQDQNNLNTIEGSKIKSSNSELIVKTKIISILIHFRNNLQQKVH